MIRVLVKASSPMAKAGLESLLRVDTNVQLVEDSPGLSRKTEAESPPDVLLVESGTLAESSAREAIHWAAAGGTVVLLVHDPAGDPVAEALRTGVKAVISSARTGPEIVATIQAAAAGLVVLDSPGIDALLRFPSPVLDGAAEALTEALTPRELEVLRLLAEGLGNKEIAARFHISEHTVKFHVASIMGKLGAASRTEAVTVGIRHGLIML